MMTPEGIRKVPVIYTEDKPYIVLKGIKEGNRFYSDNSDRYYRSDWYELIGVYDTDTEAREVLNGHYAKNPFDLYKAIHNSIFPDKIH